MKIERNLVPEMTIEQFTDEHNLTMIVKERANPEMSNLHRFYANFKEHPDISSGVFRVGAFGDGDTEEGAIRAYSEEISGKLLIFGRGAGRKEIQVPRLVTKK